MFAYFRELTHQLPDGVFTKLTVVLLCILVLLDLTLHDALVRLLGVEKLLSLLQSGLTVDTNNKRVSCVKCLLQAASNIGRKVGWPIGHFRSIILVIVNSKNGHCCSIRF